MKNLGFTTFFALLTWITYVAGVVIGPFALYTKSDDPNWNMRYIDASPRAGYNAVGDQVTDPSQIPGTYINYYINSTGLDNSSGDIGNLVWGQQTLSNIPYSAYYGGIQIFDVGSPVQPLFFELYRQTTGYTTQWSISNGQLLLNGESNFFAMLLHAPFWNYDAVLWNFAGSDAQLPANVSAITLWTYP